jgi:hypothetical protein
MKKQILIPLLAGLVLLAACKGKGRGDYEIVNNKSSSVDSDITKAADTATSPKLIKTADMNLKVKNVQQTSERIVALTGSYHGIVMHHHLGTTTEGSKNVNISNDSVMQITSQLVSADITVKIPSEKLEEFMSQITHMGMYVNNRNMDITDKSLDYLSAKLKLQSRNELIAQQKKGRIIIKSPEKVLYLKDDMVDQQIDNKSIDDAVKNSVISVSFYQSNNIYKEVIANADPSAYDISFLKRLGFALKNGWVMFVDLVIGIANTWVFIMAGIGAWLLFKHYKGKKPVELLKS